jgi:hypothetical protein
MIMYLGMTKEDYNSVVNSTPLSVAAKLCIENAENLTEDALKEEIKCHDETAYNLMRDFIATYQAWWDKSIEMGSVEFPDSSQKAALISLMDRRDEIRRALISYLNFASSKAAAPS